MEKYGEDAVVEIINTSMSSNYKGIIWDKLKNNTQNYQSRKLSEQEKARQQFLNGEKND